MSERSKDKSPEIAVKQSEPPIEKEVLAESIVKISHAMEKLLASGLNRRAIVLLVSDASRVPKTECDRVLDGLAKLEKLYCRP